MSKTRPDIDSYFMNIALVVSSRSTCLRRKVGAVIVRGKQIVSTGYNGAPQGLPHCLDIGCAREGIPSGERSELCRGAHAEQNAINFAARYGITIEGATLYSTHMPCSWCAKSIVNSGIKRVVYLHDYPDFQSKQILSHIRLEHLENFEPIQIISTAYQQEAYAVNPDHPDSKKKYDNL